MIQKFVRSLAALSLGLGMLAFAAGGPPSAPRAPSIRATASTFAATSPLTGLRERSAVRHFLAASTITGPVDPPPGGYAVSASGSGPAMMETGGQTLTFTGLDMSRFDNLWWGAYDTSSASIGVSLCNPFTFDASQPNLSSGIATWSATTNSNVAWGSFNCAFTLTVTDGSGSPIPLIHSSDLGLTQGAVVRVPADGGFRANLVMSIDGQADTISWFNFNHAANHEPPCTGGTTQFCFQDDFTGGFFYQPDAPSAVASGVTIAENTTFSGTVATVTDNDPTAHASEYTASIDWGDGTTTAGTLSTLGGGQFGVAGSHTWSDEGTYPIAVTINDTDHSGADMTADASATVTELDSLGSAGSIGVTTAADGSFSGTLATFTSGVPAGTGDFTASINWGDATTTSGVVGGGGSSLTVSGSHTYVSTGQYSVSVHIQDDGSGSAAGDATGTATFYPTAAADTYPGTAGQALNVSAPGVLQNDTGASAASESSGPSHGVLTLSSDGSFTYTPNSGFSGVDGFQYSACNNGACAAPANVTLNIAPAASADSYSTAYQTSLNVPAPGVLSNDLGTSMTTTEIAPASNGSVTLNSNGSFSYVPNSGFVGSDLFTYQACTGALCSSTTTVTIAVGSPVVANNDSYTDRYGNKLVVASPGVLGNDTGTGLTVTGVVTLPHHGTVSMHPDGSFGYTPDAGFSGQDTFRYVATDSHGQVSNPGTVTISVVPIAMPRTFSTTAGHARVVAAPGVLKGAKGFGSLSAAVVSGPSHGSLTLNGNGSFTYTPQAGFSGIDTFTYSVTDGHSAVSQPATITIDVSPVAVKDSRKTKAGSTLNVTAPGVLGNDIGTGLHAVLDTGTSNGTLTLNSDGSFSYTPNSSFSGKDAFTYSAVDSSSLVSAPATVTITISPVAVPDSYVTARDVPLVETPVTGILANDIGAGLTLGSVTATPMHGSLTISSDGSFTYTPNAGYVGSDFFRYTCRDSSGNLSAPATVTISIT